MLAGPSDGSKFNRDNFWGDDVKGLVGWGKFKCHARPVIDFQVRRCVIWNDWGRALEIGAETVAEEMSDLLFEDCAVIHSTHIALDVQNVTVENLRITGQRVTDMVTGGFTQNAFGHVVQHQLQSFQQG